MRNNFYSALRSHGFTLFELILGMTIFALLMTTVLLSVENLSVTRIKSTNKISLLEELYFFSEKLTNTIKEWGTIDFEEYFNRLTYSGLTNSGHYRVSSGFGNYGYGGIVGTQTYGQWHYYCRSGNGTRMGTGWCVSAAFNTQGVAQTGALQRYGQYGLQFIDYNGNADNETPLGDENGDGLPRGDEDDTEKGEAPTVITGSILTSSWGVVELYLINKTLRERVAFRLNYKHDPNSLTYNPATGTDPNCNISTGSGCLNNIQILRLKWLDVGLTHSGGNVTDTSAFDNEIDTWICHADWKCSGPWLPNGYGTLPSGAESEWVDLFSDQVSIRRLNLVVYPRVDPWLSWAAADNTTSSTFISPFIHPYVRMQLTLGFSWKRRKILKNEDPLINVETTISLLNN